MSVRYVTPMSTGEYALLERALRTYICAEQQAISNAHVAARESGRAKDWAHADDVKQQANARISAAEQLFNRLRSDRALHDSQ